MKRTMTSTILVLVFVSLLAQSATTQQLHPTAPPANDSGAQEATSTAQQGDAVIRWNQVLQQAVRVPHAQPPTIRVERSYAMMHAAMFDAVNSIERAFKPYFVEVRASRGASAQAAAAQAAYDTLVALYPQQQATFDAELAASLEGIPPGRARQGVAVGQAVAEKILAWRSTDGWSATPPPFSFPPDPGLWQPTPPGFSPPTLTNWPAVVPFALSSSAQFRPPPPPALTSARYTTDFIETKELGAVSSTKRTADQTLVARLFASVGTPTGPANIPNNVARDVALARGTTLVEDARLFALLNIALHDALETAVASKYHYGLWRPVTAIRRAEEDGNPETIADPGWSSLIVNPPYPAYAGNAATIGATSATILALFFGREDINFDVYWEGNPGWTRSYAGFWELAEEQARSRVYGGIHFDFDGDAGQTVGRNVGNYVFLNLMTPRRRH
ncbi:MAG: vanadium-dependent haloperoxidase [Pyrinomonadaceae bacterium]|nr:vanadium-dependent haloperoxidase [Pyrinomonadaceae bacterium]